MLALPPSISFYIFVYVVLQRPPLLKIHIVEKHFTESTNREVIFI